MGSKNRFYMDVQTLNSSVTGSCHLCIVKYPDGTTTRFIVDCGLFQGREEENDTNNYSFPFNESSIQFVLVTHTHVDHIGRLPLLVKNGFRNQIYVTPSAKPLLNLALFDSYRVLKDTAKRKHQPDLYRDVDVYQTLNLVKAIPFEKTTALDDHIKVTFFYNGHLIGASLILVEISYPGEQNINWLFTGDYNSHNMFFDIPPLPKRVLEMPLNIMQEATYGTMDSTQVVPCFEKNILSALFKSNASVVVPVFSLGRSQEILYFLKVLQNQGKLDCSVPIFFDGKLAHQYTRLYRNGSLGIKQEMLEFLPSGLQFVDTGIRDSVLIDSDRKIILTTSGMGSYGPAPQYISTFIRQSNSLIHFTGYTAEGTLGHSLHSANMGDIVRVGGILVTKRAQVEFTSEFSAHAKADELIHFLKQFENLNLVLVNHGEPYVKEAFAKRVLKEISTKDVGIANEEFFFRVSPYHLLKTMTTKFQ